MDSNSAQICAIITGPTFTDAFIQLSEALPNADLVELRLDFFTERALPLIEHFLEECPLPVLITLRKSAQGGGYEGDEDQRREEIKQILRLSPSYFDIEDDCNPSFFIEQFPAVSFVVSHHSFSSPHPPIENLYDSLRGGTYRKIAIPVATSTAALQTLNYAREKGDLILIGMGEHGSFTRILAPIANIPWCYASILKQTAPGQLSVDTLVNTYHYPKLSTSTHIYGLIGDPVDKSISEETHNTLFRELGLNAIYVKMTVTPEELPTFLPEAHKLGFKGLSVTTPLKEIVIPQLTVIDTYAEQIRGVNTLAANENGYSGSNTDGAGALNAIERHTSVKGKTLLILGVGPSGRAIAQEAKSRGATVAIVNRKGCTEKLPVHDILVNATPALSPISEEQFLPGTIAMDCNIKPYSSPFLEMAKTKHCTRIHGEEMFIEQALLQFETWGIGKAEELHPLLSKIAMRRRLTETKA